RFARIEPEQQARLLDAERIGFVIRKPYRGRRLGSHGRQVSSLRHTEREMPTAFRANIKSAHSEIYVNSPIPLPGPWRCRAAFHRCAAEEWSPSWRGPPVRPACRHGSDARTGRVTCRRASDEAKPR